MGKRVLVLGGTSYVAQFICSRFLNDAMDSTVQELACTVRAPDTALPEGFVLATEASASSASRCVRVFTGVSLLNVDSVMSVVEEFKPDAIINCVETVLLTAAMSSPAACERDPAAAKALNEPTALISSLRARSSHPIQYIHFSTDFVYDGENPPPAGYREDDAVSSETPCVYSATKLAFDQFLLNQPASPQLQVTVLRIANVVGGPAPLFPNQSPKFAQWLLQELVLSPDKQDIPVRLWSDEVRSFLNVLDLVQVIWLLLAQPMWTPSTQILNVGGVDALSRVDFAACLLQELLSHKGQASPFSHRSIAEARRAEADLGMRPTLDVRLNCSRLKAALPMLRLSTTHEIMQQLSKELTK